MSCSHEESRWEDVREYNSWTGEYDVRRELRTISFFEDISLHAMRCRRCGALKYYSQAGQISEELGVSLEQAMDIRDARAKKAKRGRGV